MDPIAHIDAFFGVLGLGFVVIAFVFFGLAASYGAYRNPTWYERYGHTLALVCGALAVLCFGAMALTFTHAGYTSFPA